MKINNRVDKLEKTTGVKAGRCRCANAVQMVGLGEPVPAPVCPRCGGARLIFVVGGIDPAKDI